MSKAFLEMRIREEVAQEMSQQIAEIENMYMYVFVALYAWHKELLPLANTLFNCCCFGLFL